MSPKLDVSQYALALALDETRSGASQTWHPRLPDHLSPSSLSMFARCPEQWRHRYLLKERERPAEATTIGSAVHRALEHNWQQKISSHADVPMPEMLDFFDDVAWGETVEDNEERAGTETLWDTTPELAHHRARMMLGEYHNDVAPRVQPLTVETMVEVDFGAPVPIWGRYDVETETEMVDVKTARQKRTTPKGDWKLQGGVYREIANKPVAFHVVSATVKTNRVSITTPLESPSLLVDPTPALRQRMREDVRMAAATIAFFFTLLGPDVPWPTSGVHHDWACNYCGFINRCPAWVV